MVAGLEPDVYRMISSSVNRLVPTPTPVDMAELYAMAEPVLGLSRTLAKLQGISMVVPGAPIVSVAIVVTPLSRVQLVLAVVCGFHVMFDDTFTRLDTEVGVIVQVAAAQNTV